MPFTGPYETKISSIDLWEADNGVFDGSLPNHGATNPIGLDFRNRKADQDRFQRLHVSRKRRRFRPWFLAHTTVSPAMVFIQANGCSTSVRMRLSSRLCSCAPPRSLPYDRLFGAPINQPNFRAEYLWRESK